MKFAQLKRRLTTMREQQTLPMFTLVCTLFTALALTLVFAQRASAQTESVLYSNFVTGSGVGGGPYTGLIADSAGNLYGAAGSDMWDGAAYELIPSAGGIWTLKILHEFTASDNVGASAAFTVDTAGNLYAPSQFGGANGWGAIFELKQISNGIWRSQILHSFANNGTDGIYPGATLTMDAAGNLYGTTQEGGLKNVGVVFELTPYAGGGGWSEKILSSLPYKQKLWSNADYPLTLDSAGNLYGVTNIGGALDGGYVFKLSPTSKGPWTLTTLYSFGVYTGPAPAVPTSGVVFDAAGNLYGATSLGGTEGYGTVYQLSPSSGGGWTERDLVDFPSSCSPVCVPHAAIIVDSAGNIFGTAGAIGTFGVAYELSPNGDGTWTLTILHNFAGGSDGADPTNSAALLDLSGKLYGTTSEGGGTKGRGTVYEITP
jgi:uncharacterized repeat protein (TIGR03803 family)